MINETNTGKLINKIVERIGRSEPNSDLNYMREILVEELEEYAAQGAQASQSRQLIELMLSALRDVVRQLPSDERLTDYRLDLAEHAESKALEWLQSQPKQSSVPAGGWMPQEGEMVVWQVEGQWPKVYRISEIYPDDPSTLMLESPYGIAAVDTADCMPFPSSPEQPTKK